MAIRATLTGKNQITVPAVIVKRYQLEPGMQLEFEFGEGQSFHVRAVPSRAELARQLEGKWRHLLKPGEDPIAELILEREEEDEAID